MKNSLPTLFKTLLATTSALTLVSGFPNTANAIDRTSQNFISDLATPTDWNPNGFNSGDSLIYGGDHLIHAHSVNIDINVIDTVSHTITTPFSVLNSNVLIGSIGSSGSGSGISVLMNPGGAGANVILSTLAGGGGILANDYSKFTTVEFNNTKGATLTIQNSSPITLPTNFLSSGGGAGKIIIKSGSSATFNGTFASGLSSRLENVDIELGATGIFDTSLYLTGGISLETGGNIVFSPNSLTVSAQGIVPTIVEVGSIIFQGNTSFEGNIGSTPYFHLNDPGLPVNNVDIGSGEVSFAGSSLTSKYLNFTANNSSLALLGSDIYIYSSLLNTTGADNKGRIRVYGTVDLMGYNTYETVVGLPGAFLENINLETDLSLNVWAPYINVQSITTNVNGEGNVIIRSDSDKEIAADIGSPLKKLNNIIPTIGPITNTWDTTTVTTLKAGKSIYAKEFKLYAENEIGYSPLDSSIFILEDNTFIDALITTTVPGPSTLSGSYYMASLYSEVDVLFNSTILQDIGTTSNKMDYIKMLGTVGSKVNLSGDLYSKFIDLKQPDIIFGDNLLFDGEVTSESTTYTLEKRILFFDNAGNSKIFGNPEVNVTVDDSDHGRFVVKGGTVNMNDNTMSHLILNLKDLAVILPPVGNIGQSYTVFGIVENSGQIVVVSDSKATLNIVQQNPFVVWSYSNGIVTRKRLPQTQVDQIIIDIVKNNGGSQTAVSNATLLADPNNTDDALSVFQDITAIIIDDESNLKKLMQALQSNIVEAAEQISEAIDQAISTIGNRLKSLGMPAFSVAQSKEGSGIAAGDEEYKHGVWTSAYYGTVLQGARGESAGFRNYTAGVIIGADTAVTDEHTIGMALSYSNNKVKHRDANEGDTSRVHTYTISIYGMQDISDKWFVQGVGLFSRNRINNRELRIIPGRIEVARGDFNVNAYGLELLAGYNHLFSNKVLMTTTFGGEYLRLSDSRYKEFGTTNQNLLITKKSDNKLDAIVGTSFSYNSVFKDYTIIPEIHGNITYDILNKSPKTVVQLAGLAGDRLINKTTEQSRIFYNLGSGISLLRGSTEFSAGYDFYYGKKYVGHQGSLKARVNF